MNGIRLWTIGHSTLPLGDFIDLVQANHIELIADIRRYPGSRRHPHFSREPLEKALGERGIGYKWYENLGGRRTPLPDSVHLGWRNEAFRGYADYMDTTEFGAAISTLLRDAKKRRTALMCAEALWWKCHRALAADYLKARGVAVLHITPSGTEKHPFTSPAKVEAGRVSYPGQPAEKPSRRRGRAEPAEGQ